MSGVVAPLTRRPAWYTGLQRRPSRGLACGMPSARSAHRPTHLNNLTAFRIVLSGRNGNTASRAETPINSPNVHEFRIKIMDRTEKSGKKWKRRGAQARHGRPYDILSPVRQLLLAYPLAA